LVAPARRALENQGINTEKKLSQYTKSEILKLHGMGPSTIPKLEKALSDKGLSFKK
jgi:DNA-directed RNA polymerase alpha subunit